MLNVDPQRRPAIDDVLKSSWLKDTAMLRTANKLMKIEPMETEDQENFLEPPTKRSRR